MTDVLKGLTVLDLGQGQAASYAGLLLAHCGASVTKIEFVGDTGLPPVKDALWNRLKSRERIDPAKAGGKARLTELLRGANMLVHDRTPSEAARLGLAPEVLDERFHDLIHAAIGGWPAGHPLEEVPVRDALALAHAGLLDEQAPLNREGPIWLRFPLGSALAAYLAVVGMLARFYALPRVGRGGRVQTSLLQGALIPMMMHWSTAEHAPAALKLGMPKDSGATLFECSDGLWIHTMGQPVNAPLVANALAAMDPSERAAFNRKYDGSVIKYIEDWGAIEAIFRTRPRDEWLAALWAADIPVQPVLRMGELYGDEQAAANAYVVEVVDPVFGKTRQPGPPMKVGTGPVDHFNAPVSPQALKTPLEGVKILDFGAFLAGPLAPMLLGDLGADVIKVEPITGDPMRRGHWAFNGCQRNKRDIALALKHSDAGEVLTKLIDWADVVHHNQRMPAAEKLGIGWDRIHEINPKAIYSHVSSYGSKGPRKDWPGYDQLFQSSAGWEYEGAGEGNRPMWHRFGMMDHLCALASVVATLLALIRRDHTGEGEFVAASLLGASLATVETFVLPDGSIAPCDRLDAEQMGIGPTRRLFAGSDGWLAVDADHEAMPEGLGQAELAELTVADALARLAEEGFDAAPVALANHEAFFADADNRAAGLIASFDHPEYGRYEQIGALWSFGDLSLQLRRPPPIVGEHSLEILEEIGASPDQRDGLIAAGVVLAADCQHDTGLSLTS